MTPAPSSEPQDILTVKNLSCSFGGLKAVDNVDFAIPRAGIRALIGPNGAGKSTIVNILSGATRPTTGSIRLEGHELAGLPAHQVARAGLVRTFQNGRLFPRLTVLENVLAGADARFTSPLLATILRTPAFRAKEAALRDLAHALLQDLGMADDAARPTTSLPYGRQRKIEIARALIGRPKILLLDEPAAGLNSGEVEGLIALVQNLRTSGLSILLIEHNMGLVMRLADSITVLNFGQKIAEGPPAAIRENARVVEAYLGRNRTNARL